MFWTLIGLMATFQHEAPDLVVDTPKIKSMNERREVRAKSLASPLEAGRVGEDRGGRLQVKSEEGLSVAQRAELRQAVQEENTDRDRLLKELARVNSGLKEAEVSRRWIDARRRCCPRGSTLQNDQGVWKKKTADTGALEADFNKKD